MAPMMAAASHSPARVHIDVVSDVVCPWCYIGKHRLERALTLTPDTAAEVEYRPYFLNPWIPREGIDRKTYLETKFGSVARYDAIAERVAAAAAAEGLAYNPKKMTRQPNTIDCHRLILWAKNAEKNGRKTGRKHGADPARVKQRLMDLYFAEGANLSDRDVLVQAAKDCGLDGDLVRRLLAGEDDVERVTSEANAAKDAGIDGVPTFIFDSSFLISGAQPPEQLASAIAQAAKPQSRETA
ncbi:MAG: DsbA family oxidoreductase [Xanthobacteraceae bacterium]